MSSTRRQPPTARSRLLLAAGVALLALLVVGSGWAVGSALAPTGADAAAARDDAYEQAYDDARTESYEAAYADAWEPAFEEGAEAGRRDGTAAGNAAARRALS